MARVFLGIGSNEGDRVANISSAIQRLGRTPGIRLVQMAPIYETTPVGGPPQDNFLNTAVELETTHSPQGVLEVVKTLERQMGRLPAAVRWGPRVIDLDILLYDERVIQDPQLIIPHPRLHERWFVLEPLAQLAPAYVHPMLGQSISQLLANLAHQPGFSSPGVIDDQPSSA